MALDIPTPLKRLMADMYRDIQQSGMKREEELAKADPRKHRLSRVFPAGVKLNYVYYRAGKDGRGRTVDFCHSTNRNVAGYFLAWREVTSAKETKRDRYTASRSKKRVQDVCRTRRESFKAKRAK